MFVCLEEKFIVELVISVKFKLILIISRLGTYYQHFKVICYNIIELKNRDLGRLSRFCETLNYHCTMQIDTYIKLYNSKNLINVYLPSFNDFINFINVFFM